MNIRSEVDKLIASDGIVDDQFGYSVSISSDGNTAIVGVPYGNNGKGTSTGSAYIFIRSGDVWIEQAKLLASDGSGVDGFGWSVSISSDGNTAIVGAHRDDTYRGSAYIYIRTNGKWSQQSKLLASDGVDGDYFGISVAISSDGNTAIIGANRDNNERGINAGIAYIYTRTGSTWSEQAKLLANDGADGDWFGRSVAISSDGNTAIVGAYYDDSRRGSVYIYAHTNGTWSEETKLLASDGTNSDQFGYSVSISGDGNNVIVGAHGNDNVNGTDAGSAYIYTRTNGTWIEQDKLLASHGASGDAFGASVAISGDGNTAIVGAHWHNDGKGAAYVYTRTNSAWCEQAKLLASHGDGDDYIGISVAISNDGNTTIVGAIGDDNVNGIDAGSAYIFDLT